ncbi:amidohydrolase family protein [Dactylosporangium sp. CA-139066]|uniref:amidohydrolase family protein n=1 Tax=Dactylosporangium sp. CA-139066 TaxID=3239930 RepID=UPI003D9129D8
MSGTERSGVAAHHEHRVSSAPERSGGDGGLVIDGHTHVYPDRVAKKALAGSVSDLKRFGDGTVAGLAEVMAAAGVDRSVCLGVANTPDRVDNANRFAGSLDPGLFIGFGSVHPGLSPEENVASLRAHGLRGAKIHPMFQNVRLDDPRLHATLDAMQGEFAVVIHVGAAGDDPGERCSPVMLAELARLFPRLDLIACHFGGYRHFEQAAEVVCGLPVYLDTSWPPSLAALQPERVRAVVERHGPDRVVFASDWPMADPAAEIEAIRALGLSADDTAAVLGGNLARLLSIEA